MTTEQTPEQRARGAVVRAVKRASAHADARDGCARCESIATALDLLCAERYAAGKVAGLRSIECEMGGPNRYHFVYGGFPGGDPRKFEPDVESCTAAEIAAHKAACAEWDAGTGTDRGPGCVTMGDGSNFTGAGFGIGTYEWDCDLCGPLTEAEAEYEAAVAALEADNG